MVSLNIPPDMLEVEFYKAQDLRTKVREIAEQHRLLVEDRNCLPRNDKAGAAALLTLVLRKQAELQTARNMLRDATASFTRRETHSLWERSVIALWGDSGLNACRAQMREERRKLADQGLSLTRPAAAELGRAEGDTP